MKLRFNLTIEFADDGKVDREAIEANINFVLYRGVDEGQIIPNDDDHASFVELDLTPANEE